MIIEFYLVEESDQTEFTLETFLDARHRDIRDRCLFLRKLEEDKFNKIIRLVSVKLIQILL